MATIEDIRGVIDRRFEHVTDLGNGVLRAEQCYDGRAYAVAYFDLSDSIVQRSGDLSAFQENLMGAEFFNSEGDLRWNSYMYFVAGPNSTAESKRFDEAKRHIEGDRHFARKFVIAPDDLALRLGEPAANEGVAGAPLGDVEQIWSRLLNDGALSSLTAQPARRTTVEKIADGSEFFAVYSHTSARPIADPLGGGKLRAVSIQSFRPSSNGRSFSFGDVNLIVGSNGTGKTSLLEAVEALYCGRVRRDDTAAVSGIKGIFDGDDGRPVEISAASSTQILKSRNKRWYGRTDFQTTALSEAFTRFNFLDTDAAFRLSTAEKPEDIRTDLDSLLVGSDTSGLWRYLTKLHDDVKARLKSLTEQLPKQEQSIQLLQAEVERLKAGPSEATSLVGAYQQSLRRFAPTWPSSNGAFLDDADRVKLQSLRQAIGQIQATVPETPVTREGIELRVARMRETLDAVKRHQAERDRLAKEEADELKAVKALEAQKTILERWIRFLEAGVPELLATLDTANSRVSELRRVLRTWPGKSLPPLAPEYVAVGVGEAQQIAAERLASAQEAANVAQTALAQSMQLGQSLQALRQDLHDAASAYIERSGETSRCPVCKTEHVPSELSARLEELIASQEAGATESFRRNLVNSREQLARCMQDASTVDAIAGFAAVSGISSEATCGFVLESARSASVSLAGAISEVQAREATLLTLQEQGLQTQGFERFRSDSVAPILPAGIDANSQPYIQGFLNSREEAATAAAGKAADLRRSYQAVMLKIEESLNLELGPAPASGGVRDAATLERRLKLTEAALASATEVAESLALQPSASFEEVGALVEATLLAFDKAKHAIQADGQARTALQERSKQLTEASKSFADDTTKRKNFLRASETLSTIVEQNSLEDATKEAFASIRDSVSKIFAQIHAPQEYVLGDFSSDKLIVNRSNGSIHAINQVSTGQRAALALSIFLALNDSAKSAPAVILIDDPVAHIDDLNTLSFLDYLRAVALRGQKQVFFATADIRLAALFQRKFEFLGGERFKRISLPQENTEPRQPPAAAVETTH